MIRTMYSDMRDASACAAPDFKPEAVISGERRREPRYPCNDAVEIRRIPGDSVRMPARALDVSRRGLRVALDTQLEKGSLVEIILPKQVVIFGEVRYCRWSSERYHAGIRIEDAFYALGADAEHIHEDKLRLYAGGNGLALREVIAIGQHLRQCRFCNERLSDALLPPDQSPRHNDKLPS